MGYEKHVIWGEAAKLPHVFFTENDNIPCRNFGGALIGKNVAPIG